VLARASRDEGPSARSDDRQARHDRSRRGHRAVGPLQAR
jgi:hypothetical protein